MILLAGKSYSQYVNPLIGSQGHGHVFVGASVPHGMVQVGPNNNSIGWDWCSGYNYSDSTITGFAQTHLSGTGIADLGDIIFLPTVSTDFNDVATYNKLNQKAELGYYSVLFNRTNIQAEMTATERTSLQRYSFPLGSQRIVRVDLNSAPKSIMGRKGCLDAYVKVINDSTIGGYRKSNEWATNHEVYFVTIFSEKISNIDYSEDSRVAMIHFDSAYLPLMAKTGISYTSSMGAMNNLLSEQNGWNFDSVRANAMKKWDEALSTIEFSSQDKDVMSIFYTGLFHTMISPSIFSDIDGAYRGADGNNHVAKGFTPYTIFSLWDTYRAVHPLFTLIDERNADYVNSLLDIYEKQGELPMWHLAGNETNCMVGLHSVPVIVDACLKNIGGIDKQRALKAVSSLGTSNKEGLNFIRTKGYIPADSVNWSVAKGLEYAIDFYAVAELANNLGDIKTYNSFSKWAKSYTSYFDKKTGFMRGRLNDGSFRKNFNPFHSLHMEDDYVEGNAWQYTWLVPHDIEGLVKLFGGRNQFMKKLDSLYTVSSELNEGASIDITGMIGQFAHGNEPSHHILYIYSYLGENHKSAEKIQQVYDEFYKNTPDGIIGNEDCGQMSAWYIFSALGFYPMNPISGEFVFGKPLLESAKINLVNGKTLRIEAKNNSKGKYIKRILLNGTKIVGNKISYSELMQGGILEYQME